MYVPRISFRVLYATVLALAVPGALSTAGFASTAPSHTLPGLHPGGVARHGALKSPIPHVVVIVQENRTVDNLFNGFAGADTVPIDPVTGSPLQKCPLYEQAGGCPLGSNQNTACDPSHMHEPGPPPATQQGFSVEYDGGAMDGFQNEHGSGCTKVNMENVAYSYVPPDEVTQYWGFASSYAFVNHALQTNNGPSFPAHQYLIAGQAGGLTSTGTINASFPWSIDENATNPKRTKSQSYNSCLTPMAFATAVDLTSPYPGNESNNEVHP